MSVRSETISPAALTRRLQGIPVATIVWLLSYSRPSESADAVVVALHLTREAHFGKAMHFPFFDTPKVLRLLVAIVFVMRIVQTFFAPERNRSCFCEAPSE